MGDWTIDELIAPLPDARRETAETLRALVKRVVPRTIEAVRPGWRVINYRVPNGRRAPVFGWVMPETKHVHLGFEYGIFMQDVDGILGGRDLRKVRYLTFERAEQIDEALTEDLLRDAVRLACMTRAERMSSLLERDDDLTSTSDHAAEGHETTG